MCGSGRSGRGDSNSSGDERSESTSKDDLLGEDEGNKEQQVLLNTLLEDLVSRTADKRGLEEGGAVREDSVAGGQGVTKQLVLTVDPMLTAIELSQSEVR